MIFRVVTCDRSEHVHVMEDVPVPEATHVMMLVLCSVPHMLVGTVFHTHHSKCAATANLPLRGVQHCSNSDSSARHYISRSVAYAALIELSVKA